MLILVVDSVSLVLRNLDRLLTTHGHEVITANSCEDAIKILNRDHRVRLVITDLCVGGMTASDLFKANRKNERINDDNFSCPPEFILLTHPRSENCRHGIDVQLHQELVDLGFIDVLFKPLIRDELMKHVRQIEGTEQRVSPPSLRSNRQKTATDEPRITEHFQRLDNKQAKFEKKMDKSQEIQTNIPLEMTQIKKWLRMIFPDK